MIAASAMPTMCGFTASRAGIEALSPALAGASSTGQSTPPALAATMASLNTGAYRALYAYVS